MKQGLQIAIGMLATMGILAWVGEYLDPIIAKLYWLVITKLRLPVIFFWCMIAGGQTTVRPGQVPWSQVDASFYSTNCVKGGAAYVANAHQTRGTAIRVSQITGYGMTVSADGKVLKIETWEGKWEIRPKNTTSFGQIHLRFAMLTPNVNLQGLTYGDVDITGSGGWAMSQGGSYKLAALARAELRNGVFKLLPREVAYRSACEVWGAK